MLFNVDRLIYQMEVNDLDAIVACTKENIHYFTGFDPVIKILNPYQGQCYAVITAEQPSVVHVVHSIGEIDQVLDATSNIGRVVTYGTFYRECTDTEILTREERLLRHYSDIKQSKKNGEEALCFLLNELKVTNGRIGIDEEGISPNIKQFVCFKLSEATFINSSRIIKQIRAVKTSEEIKALSYAAHCIEDAIDAVATELYEGMSELEILQIFNASIVSKRALPILPMLKIGRHAVGGQRKQQKNIKLKAGDVIWFDCDIVCNGYWADIARVLFFKDLKDSASKYRSLYQGQLEAINLIKPGMTGGDVFNLTMDAVHNAGFKEYRRHHVGHGIGLEPYEFPVLEPNNKEIIEEGMVISLETPYYEFGLGALHVEDPILIQHDKNKILTRNSGNIRIVEGK